MIGIFDSGLGGLTILKAIVKKLPGYDYVYLGDSARAPYGNKSREVIYGYTKQAVDFLFSQGCELIVIACNTASAEALRRIQREHLPKKYPRQRVLGVIRPLVEEVARNKNIKKAGMIGTRATVESNVYKIELRALNPNLEVVQQAAPLLVPLIEEGWATKPETKMILKKYLRPLKAKQINTLIPACTHYPFLLKDMRRIMTKRCRVLDPGEVVASSLTGYLARHAELNIVSSASPQTVFYTTDDVDKFKTLGEKFLGAPMKSVQKITLYNNGL